MPQSFASLHVHIVFSTKNPAPLIDTELTPRLHEYIGGIARARGSALVAAGGMPDHAWQTGYGAFAVSYSNLPTVKRYIAGQAEHHRTRTFQEEFVALLRRHNLPFDESHLWD